MFYLQCHFRYQYRYPIRLSVLLEASFFVIPPHSPRLDVSFACFFLDFSWLCHSLRNLFFKVFVNNKSIGIYWKHLYVGKFIYMYFFINLAVKIFKSVACQFLILKLYILPCPIFLYLYFFQVSLSGRDIFCIFFFAFRFGQ